MTFTTGRSLRLPSLLNVFLSNILSAVPALILAKGFYDKKLNVIQKGTQCHMSKIWFSWKSTIALQVCSICKKKNMKYRFCFPFSSPFLSSPLLSPPLPSSPLPFPLFPSPLLSFAFLCLGWT
jgi:hypothetical protein